MKVLNVFALFLTLVGLSGCLGGGLNPNGSDPSVPVTVGNGGNNIVPAISLTSGEAATGGIIGQALATGNSAGTGGVDVTHISAPIGNPVISPAGVLYVPDSALHRTLGFNTVPTSNAPVADFAMTADNTASHNTSVITQAGQLLTSLPANDDAIVFWNTAPLASTGANDYAVNSHNGSVSSPIDRVFIDITTVGTKLVAANGSSNNILIFNSIPTNASPNPVADIVLTQSSVGALSNPKGVWTDGTKLVVSDTANNRVLIWNTFPSSDVPPNLVLDSTSGVALNQPTAITSNGSELFVADTGNNRVLIWNQFPTASHQAPSVVLGQVDFNAVSANRGASTDANTLSSPAGLYMHGTKLFVCDTGNNRILIFNSN